MRMNVDELNRLMEKRDLYAINRRKNFMPNLEYILDHQSRWKIKRERQRKILNELNMTFDIVLNVNIKYFS